MARGRGITSFGQAFTPFGKSSAERILKYGDVTLSDSTLDTALLTEAIRDNVVLTDSISPSGQVITVDALIAILLVIDTKLTNGTVTLKDSLGD